MNTRQNGIYYTTLFNPFEYNAFRGWIHKHGIEHEPVLEPFAGCNSIIDMLQAVGFAGKYQSYDIYPQSPVVKQRDTISSYPAGYKVCVTNPPWLYKSSAHRRGLYFPATKYDDLYKLCLSIALENNEYVGSLIPASFIQSGLFTERLERVIFLHRPLFTDTENPVCLALFGSTPTDDIEVYNDDCFIDYYQKLKEHLPPVNNTAGISFNIPNGSLGFIAIDDNISPSIRFCRGENLGKYNIGYSSRSITRIAGVDTTTALIKRANDYVNDVREKTNDIFLTTFKGLRKDGKYRRRMEYKLARGIIGVCK